jgi:hypothetical protein
MPDGLILEFEGVGRARYEAVNERLESTGSSSKCGIPVMRRSGS